MVFRADATVWSLPPIPDTVPLCEFIFDERYGRRPMAESLDPFICGISGKRISPQEQKDRVDHLARALAKHFAWNVNEGTEFDKVAVIFAPNTIDTMTISWALHRVNGLSSPANSVYSADELRHQLETSRAKAIFTVASLLPVALEAAEKHKVNKGHIILCEMPGDHSYPRDFRTVSQLIEEGRHLPALEALAWAKGQGARQTAFLCFSSGTSGVPKAVMISHYNVIANVLQLQVYEQPMRDAIQPNWRDVTVGLMPFSHIYGLVAVCHIGLYRGDSMVVLPKFDIRAFLSTIEAYKINTLPIVPPIIITMTKQKALCDRYDLTSVKQILSGAAPLSREVAQKLSSQHGSWVIRQGYGLTETATAVASSPSWDIWLGSSGCIMPGVEAKLLSPEGVEITAYNQPGELLIKSPSVVLGYLNNPQANEETFIDMPDGRYLKTGDEVEIRLSPAGNEHIWVVDRIKELIKVKGLQVAPAELEGCLLEHPAVTDCAVIPVPDERAGELPKAFVVKSPDFDTCDQVDLKQSIIKHVEKVKARHKRLADVEFIDIIPKSPSGKILRRVLRDRERQRTKYLDAKL
ncbi:4-coumarate-CoA ligase, variant [Ilyonectria robusta]|uniref:4-coumarate-CoA ligase, variant n=1 Tax=Ilyonectria robusta TaxID=1079257 RepID=UPI001E8E1107|nr:4-coumarate-CoA ligase, variant [Ilyonectria robusta]KAH8652021.1 4-coumarate-CoA ligase, variant [Ilyonectria robusta]